MRTDLTSEIDAALAGRNGGSKGYWEVARSGNGNMMTDLLAEDGESYEELEGMGESVEEMTNAESRSADRGDNSVAKPYREAMPSEQPPHAPKPGMTWIRRRIPMQSRRPGGNRLMRLRWAQVDREKYNELARNGLIQSAPAGVAGMGFMDISSDLIKGLMFGAVAVVGYQYLKRRGIIRLGGA